jgi:hypothetical protein
MGLIAAIAAAIKPINPNSRSLEVRFWVWVQFFEGQSIEAKALF